eukprot:CAMPEP_0170512380 /NCGR_PEP_ID=MMETSP0208-20121228/66817_1 /TAXON_ID=197538 /ORGANISM="Strombidium inclinatum, Strain S3" /LENGTH=60 /DNA_ID=CAMNT_0010796001 /DNA_START=154 /DNA_END=336 /DNA_ORIENTATION=-
MASCQAITYVGDELVGDPLEIKMFESTEWVLDEQTEGGNSMMEQDDIVLARVYPKEESLN